MGVAMSLAIGSEKETGQSKKPPNFVENCSTPSKILKTVICSLSWHLLVGGIYLPAREHFILKVDVVEEIGLV